MTRAIVVLATTIALVACSTSDPPATPQVPPDASRVARIVCEADGSTSVATPDVVARPDGVHVRVMSALDEPASVSIGGIGWDVDSGESRSVTAIPPGRATVSCWPFSEHAPGGSDPVPEPITIHDPDGMFVEGELECIDGDDGTALDIRLLPSARGRRDPSITPGEARPLIGGLLDTDELLVPGYPETVHQSLVVVRDGRRIASVGFSFERGRWIQAGGNVCGGATVTA
jgi:hypothetical protein